jgi:hypothetical protein
MTFRHQDLANLDLTPLGVDRAQENWEACVVDPLRDAAVIRCWTHYSEYPDQEFLLFLRKRKTVFIFSHSRNQTPEQPGLTYFKARWTVPDDIPEHEIGERNDAIAEAIQCMYGFDRKATDGGAREVRVTANLPDPPTPLTLEAIIFRINTLVELSYSVERLKCRKEDELADSSTFQAEVVDRLRKVILRNPQSRALVLDYLSRNDVGAFTKEARRAVDWWKASEH